MSLLEEAKEIQKEHHKPKPLKYGEEHFELAMAWLNDEIGLSALSIVMYPGSTKASRSGSALYAIAKILKIAYQNGRLQIKK